MTTQAKQHADYIRRYAERLCNGPAVKEYAFPINHNREDADVAKTVRKHLYAVAGAIEAELPVEEYWPQANDGAVTHDP